MKKTRFVPFLSLTALLLAAPLARAGFIFTNIADSTSPTYSSFGGRPSINATGTVGFSGGLDAGDSGISTGNGTTTRIIARTNGMYSYLTDSTINDAGTLGFYAYLDAGGIGLFTSNGTTTTTIALNSGSTHGGPTYSNFGFTPAINAGGTLAFRASLDSPSSALGLYTSNGTTTTTIGVTHGSTYNGFSAINSINAVGTVGFYGQLDSGGGNGIFTSNGTTTTTIALESGPTFSYLAGLAAINSVGMVAFQANLDGGGSGLFVGNGTSTSAIALDSTFTNFQGLFSINTAGMVAFEASLDGNGGLFLGDGTTTTQVIRIGDALFGSTVSTLEMGETGLNDSNQLAFKYTLANGVTGVAVASIPEPGSAGMLLGGAAFLGLRRRARTPSRPSA